MNPPPPMLPAAGYVTARANAVATAASTALPPRLRMETPTSDAGREMETTAPWRHATESLEYFPGGTSGITFVRGSGCTHPATAATRRVIGRLRDFMFFSGLNGTVQCGVVLRFNRNIRRGGNRGRFVMISGDRVGKNVQTDGDHE